MPNVASQIWPHLPSDKSVPKQQQRGDLASAMYPDLVKAKPPFDPIGDYYRTMNESLLRNLRELNRRVDERLAKEKR